MLVKIILINITDPIIKKHLNIEFRKLHNLLLQDHNIVLIKNLLQKDTLLIHNLHCHHQILGNLKKLKDLKFFRLKLKLSNKDNLISIKKKNFHPLINNRQLDLLENLQDNNPIIFFHKMTE